MSGLECSTLNFIKDYLVALSEYIKDNFQDDFLVRINLSLGMNPQEFLKTFNKKKTTKNLKNKKSVKLQKSLNTKNLKNIFKY